MDDPIIEEVRRIRDEHASQFAYDLDAIWSELQRVAREDNNPRVHLQPRRTVETCPAKQDPITI
jgi:hypothetical protein